MLIRILTLHQISGLYNVFEGYVIYIVFFPLVSIHNTGRLLQRASWMISIHQWCRQILFKVGVVMYDLHLAGKLTTKLDLS